jgi:hypothetical protein
MLVSVPYGTYGGILADDETATRPCHRRDASWRECRARVLDLRSATADLPGFEPVAGYLGFRRVAAASQRRAGVARRSAPAGAAGMPVTATASPSSMTWPCCRVVWQLYAAACAASPRSTTRTASSRGLPPRSASAPG